MYAREVLKVKSLREEVNRVGLRCSSQIVDVGKARFGTIPGNDETIKHRMQTETLQGLLSTVWS